MRKFNALIFLFTFLSSLLTSVGFSDNESNGYTVRFETNGGTSMTELVGVTSIAVLPEITRAGYTFGGWFTDNDTLLRR